MDSIFEVQRQTHEEIEHLERALYTTLSKPQPTHQARLQNEHKASQLLDRIHSRVVTLNDLYDDQDSRKNEVDLLSAPRQDDLSSFYDRLSKIQEHYAKYPDATVGGFELELSAFLDEAEEMDEEEFEQDDRAYLSLQLMRLHLTGSRTHSYCIAVLWRRELRQISRFVR